MEPDRASRPVFVSEEGEIGWLSWPTASAPSVFASRTDTAAGGRYRIAPVGESFSCRLRANALELVATRFVTATGAAELRDWILPGPPPQLIRHLVGTDGVVHFELELRPSFGGGSDRHSTAVTREGAVFRSPDLTLALRTHVALDLRGDGVFAEFDIRAGERLRFELRDPRDRSAADLASEARMRQRLGHEEQTV